MRLPATTLLVCMGFLVASLPAAAGESPDARPIRYVSGEWVVRDRVVVEDEILYVNGTIIVAPGGELVLRHVDLVFGGANATRGLVSQSPAMLEAAEGDDPHAKWERITAPKNESSGAIRLLSTPKGITRVTVDGPDRAYYFVAWGPLEMRGLPGLPVVVEHVAGRSGGAEVGLQKPLFTNGLQILGSPNVLDRVLVRWTDSGVGVGSKGTTLIANSTIRELGVPLYLHGAWNVDVRNTTLHGYRSALVAERARNVHVTDSTLEGGSIAVLGYQSDLAFRNVSVRARDVGALVRDGGDYEFRDSRFAGYGLNAIAVTRDPVENRALPNLTAVGNELDGGGIAKAGVDVEMAGAVRLEANRAFGHREHGLAVVLASNVVAERNVAERNGRLGIQIAAAPFREAENAFGDDASSRNGVGGFSGIAPVNVLVKDRFGDAVEGATVTVEAAHLPEPASERTGPDGRTGFLLEALNITSDGVRHERRYTITAFHPDHPLGRVEIGPEDVAVALHEVTLGHVAPASKAQDALRGIPAPGAAVALAAVALGLAVARSARR